jgi:micrococcal nuclease
MDTLLKLRQPKYLLTLLAIFVIAGLGAVQDELFGTPIVAPVSPTWPQGATTSQADPFATRLDTPFKVVKIIDGDTIVASEKGKSVTVRLIGINAPETGLGSRPKECFGAEASKHLADILPVGTEIALDTDSSQGTYDKYNRVLAYVMLADHTNINLMMIQDGYAYEYTYNQPYLYVAAFKESQQIAREEGKGLWASGACGLPNVTP